MITIAMSSSNTIIEVRVHIKNMSQILKNHVPDGANQISVFAFLDSFLNETGMLNTSEVQSFFTVLDFFSEPAKTHFASIKAARTSMVATSTYLKW